MIVGAWMRKSGGDKRTDQQSQRITATRLDTHHEIVSNPKLRHRERQRLRTTDNSPSSTHLLSVALHTVLLL